MIQIKASPLGQLLEGPPLLALLVSLLISSSQPPWKSYCPFVKLVSLISLGSPALWFPPELCQWPNLFLIQPAKTSSPYKGWSWGRETAAVPACSANGTTVACTGTGRDTQLLHKNDTSDRRPGTVFTTLRSWPCQDSNFPRRLFTLVPLKSVYAGAAQDTTLP